MQGPSQNQLRRRYNEAANRAASFARREHPHLAGILVHGSVARGEPGPFSDIDMLGVTNQKRKPADFSFFDGDIYVGVGFLSLAELEREFTDPRAFFWARGSAETTRILYDPRGILRRLMLRWNKAKLPSRVLEKSLWDAYHNIIEYSGKLRNGWLNRNDFLTRYSARIVAEHVERAIIALNDLSIISENYASPDSERGKKTKASRYRLSPSSWNKGDGRHGIGLSICHETLRRDSAPRQSRVRRKSETQTVQRSARSALREARIVNLSTSRLSDIGRSHQFPPYQKNRYTILNSKDGETCILREAQPFVGSYLGRTKAAA